eukprot:c15929_g1_i2 orf=14-235(-)
MCKSTQNSINVIVTSIKCVNLYFHSLDYQCSIKNCVAKLSPTKTNERAKEGDMGSKVSRSPPFLFHALIGSLL